MAKLKTAAENDLSFEKKQHEKTILELARARHQIRELKKDVHHLQNKLRLCEKEMEDQDTESELKHTGEFKSIESGLSRSLREKSLVNTSVNESGCMSLMKVQQDKSDYLAKENERLLKRVEELENQLYESGNKGSQEIDFQRNFERLAKEAENKILLLQNENISVSKDNEALRERLEKLEIELNRLRGENYELRRRCEELVQRSLVVEPDTPNKSSEAKLTNNSTPQSNPLRSTKSFTTSKKGYEGKNTERGERFYSQKDDYDIGDLDLNDCRNLLTKVIIF